MEQRPHRTLPTALAAAAMLLAGGAAAYAQYNADPQPRPGMTPGFAPGTQVTTGDTTVVHTAVGIFPSSNPDINPTNLLPTIYSNIKDSAGVEIPNTLTSSAARPYNLHPDPVVTPINAASPADDLWDILKSFHKKSGNQQDNGKDDDRENPDNIKIDSAAAQRAIDIIEGNPVPGRAYSGLPLLHYNGPDKIKTVQPIKDAGGNTIGGNVVIHQIWYRSHIESDTSLLDVSLVRDVPWTITYHVDTLHRGRDDFAPSVMYFDDPNLFGGAAVPHIMEDQTFFPMEEGTRTTFDISMAPGRFYNLTYTWGWRVHPGRVQVSENAGKVVAGKNLLQWEVDAFGPTPGLNAETKAAAIAKISNLAPAKRMWHAFKAMKTVSGGPAAKALVEEAEAAFDDWEHRSRMPRGVTADPNADITLFYANNTIYAHVKNYVDPKSHMEFTEWHLRGKNIKVKIINGDYFQRAYMNVDFGGMRGWENTFHNTIPIGGAGPWFTFGRHHWWPNVMPVMVPPAQPAAALPTVPVSVVSKKYGGKEVRDDRNDPDGRFVRFDRRPSLPNGNGDVLGVHNIDLTLNFEPSRRIRLYQFDPLHHDVAVFSIH